MEQARGQSAGGGRPRQTRLPKASWLARFTTRLTCSQGRTLLPLLQQTGAQTTTSCPRCAAWPLCAVARRLLCSRSSSLMYGDYSSRNRGRHCMRGDGVLSAGLSSVQAAAGPSGGAADTLTSGLGTDELAELLARAEAANKKGVVARLAFSVASHDMHVIEAHIMLVWFMQVQRDSISHASLFTRSFIYSKVRLCMLPAAMCQLTASVAYIRHAYPEAQAAGLGEQRRTRPAA